MLLIRRPNGWSFSIGEVPEAIGCGPLTDLSADAPFEAARDALAAILRQDYGVDVPAEAWDVTENDHWVLDLEEG